MSPPWKSRSRLDHLILLLLRALALTLLAIAFARPFLRFAADLSFAAADGRQIAILVDTSASMRRGDLWDQAIERVEEVLAGLEPADDVGLFAFDEQLRHFADQRIGLDLDDGVKVNYGKFGNLLAEVKAITGESGDE